MARPAENGHGWARRGSLGRISGQGSHVGTGCYDDAHHQSASSSSALNVVVVRPVVAGIGEMDAGYAG